MPVGPVYATWAGLGTTAVAVLGAVVFHERLPTGAWLGVACVVFGVMLLGYFAPVK